MAYWIGEQNRRTIRIESTKGDSKMASYRMYYVKDVNTKEELFWTSHESWAKRFMFDENLRLVTREKDNRGNITLWVEAR